MTRRIAHLDMDAFFASVELLNFPELRGRAVVVGGGRVAHPVQSDGGVRHFSRLKDYVGRGIVTTSTYEARALGIFSGMGLMQSARLAPEAILLPADFEAYRRYSRRFKAAVAAIAPRIEDRGIDEIYVDLSDSPEDAHCLAARMQQAVFDATGLSCSIGIAPNKLLAKICSDLNKPKGITLLESDDIVEHIWPLPAAKISGIGPKSAARLARLGIHTIGELARTPLAFLIAHFGAASGRWMHRAARGIDERPLALEAEPKSIGRENTFERDLHVGQDRAVLSEILTSLCQRVADDLRRRGYCCRTVGIKLRYADFQSVTRELTSPFAINGAAEIRSAARACLRRLSLRQKIRLLGVRASSLSPLHTASAAMPEARQMALRF